MPAVGLPRAAEAILTTLLTDHNVTSWKLTGEGDTTVFVLKLSCVAGLTQSPLQPAVYRKKPPSQARDRRRAEQRQQQHLLQHPPGVVSTLLSDQPQAYISSSNNGTETEPQDSNTANELHKAVQTMEKVSDFGDCSMYSKKEVPTLKASDYAPGNSSSQDTLTLADINGLCSTASASVPVCSSTHAHNTSVPASPARASHEDFFTDMGQLPTAVTAAIDRPARESEGDPTSDTASVNKETKSIHLDQLAAEGEFCMEDVKAVISKTNNQVTKERLKDASRNRELLCVVLDHRGWNREELKAETDDFVLMYDCRTKARNWFLKSPTDQKDFYRRSVLYAIHNWPPITDTYSDERKLMQQDVQILCHLFRALLE